MWCAQIDGNDEVTVYVDGVSVVTTSTTKSFTMPSSWNVGILDLEEIQIVKTSIRIELKISMLIGRFRDNYNAVFFVGKLR